MISGADSPIARESARIDPVAMPGIAAGSTCRETTCHGVAPSAKAPSRTPCGTLRIASRAAMMIVGSTSSVRISPPARTTRPRLAPCTRKPSPRMP